MHDLDMANSSPIVLVHGSASDERTWAGVSARLAVDHRLVVPTRRHHGPSAPETGSYSMREQVDDLRAIVDQVPDGPVHLVGHSYGALLSLHVALEGARGLRSLTLVEPPAYRLFISDPPTPAQLLRVLATRPRTAAALVRFGARGLGPARAAAERDDLEEAVTRFGRAVLGRQAFARLSTARWQQVLDNNIRAEYLADEYLALPSDDLRELSLPCLLVVGRRSPAMFGRLAARLAELLPDSRTTRVVDASHLVHEDAPEAFVQALRGFLRDVETGVRSRC